MRKKSHEKRLEKAIESNKDFLLKRLSKKWVALHQNENMEKAMHVAKISAEVAAKSILVLLMLGGIVVVASVAPNLFSLLGSRGKRQFYLRRNEFLHGQNYLKKRKFATVKTEEGKYKIEITKEGQAIILRNTFHDLVVNQPERWDKIWRIVIFDIPNDKKWVRDTFRKSLREMGFFQVQKSVFISPYPCEEEVEFLVGIFDIVGHVRVIQAEKLIHDNDIREFFSIR